MPRDRLDPDEPLYVISVAARMVNLHPQTLRHYERLGLIDPARTEGGVRMYSQRDVERLNRISGLIEDLGVNLAGVEVILNMSRQIEELQAQMKQMEAQFEVEIERMRRVMLEDKAVQRPRLPEPTAASTDESS
jgi:MerR family transcriptional regulator, heat shock protein HspR